MFKKVLIFGAGALVGYFGGMTILGINAAFNERTVFENEDILVRVTPFYDTHGWDMTYVYDKHKNPEKWSKYSKA